MEFGLFILSREWSAPRRAARAPPPPRDAGPHRPALLAAGHASAAPRSLPPALLVQPRCSERLQNRSAQNPLSGHHTWDLTILRTHHLLVLF